VRARIALCVSALCRRGAVRARHSITTSTVLARTRFRHSVTDASTLRSRVLVDSASQCCRSHRRRCTITHTVSHTRTLRSRAHTHAHTETQLAVHASEQCAHRLADSYRTH
jgi:hypothetical protein